MNGSFPSLERLSLAFNPSLEGQLPEAWGSTPAMAQLRAFEADGCGFTGDLDMASSPPWMCMSWLTAEKCTVLLWIPGQLL